MPEHATETNPGSSDLRSLVEADLYRACGSTSGALLVRQAIGNRTFRVVLSLRLCQWTRRTGSLTWRFAHGAARAFHRWTCQRASIDLPWITKIGPGFSIVHGWGVVIAPSATIGANVTVLQGATIGRGDKITAEGRETGGAPVVEDRVWIGPGAVVLGGIVVGSGSRVLANSVVVKDVPAASLVSGVPAAILQADCPEDVYNPAPLRYTPAPLGDRSPDQAGKAPNSSS